MPCVIEPLIWSYINKRTILIDTGNNNQGPYKLSYSDFSGGDKKLKELTVDLLIGADGANSRVAKAMDAEIKSLLHFKKELNCKKKK